MRQGRSFYPFGNTLEFLQQSHSAAANRGAETGRIFIFGLKYRYGQHILQDGCYMQGTIAFSRSDINIDRIEFQVQHIQYDGAKYGTIDLGQIRGGQFDVRPDHGRIKIMYCYIVGIKSPDDLQGRHADNTYGLNFSSH